MSSIIHRAFDEPHDYARCIRLARVSDLIVSERGSFDATLTVVNVGNVWLQSGRESLARTMRIAIGDSPRSLAFLAGGQAATVIQSGAEFGAGDVVCFGQNTNHFQRSFGPIRWLGISLKPGDFEKAIKAMNGAEVLDPSASLWGKPSAENLNRLRGLHVEVIRMASAGEVSLDYPEVQLSLEQAFAQAMTACLANGTDGLSSPGRSRHQQVMLRFAEWLDANSERAAYLQDVCSALGVSAPTLRRCCAEHLGMTPMHYLWLRRMNLARQELQQRPTSVTAAAMNFGFWHLGRFAEEYRTLFGESPGATLARHSAS